MDMTRLTQDQIAKWLDPFTNDPLVAINIIKNRKEPLVLVLNLEDKTDILYHQVEQSLLPYGGVLDPYVHFSSIVGYAMTDFDKAKQLVQDQNEGRLPGIKKVSVDSMSMEICGYKGRTINSYKS